MSLYKYTVTNKDGKKLSGTIEASSEMLARKELNDLGFSILDFALTAPEENIQKEGSIKFEFEAIDNHSKIVKGTIPSQSAEIASKRLKNEYDLTLLAIWEKNASEEEIAKAKKNGQENLKIYLEELAKEKEKIDSQKGSSKEQIYIKDKVDFILKQVLILLKKFDEEFSTETKTEINKKIDKLLRIKNSSNTEYIQITAKDLLTYIEAQAKTLEDKGYQNKKIELKLETSSLLDQLKKTQAPPSIKEDLNQKLIKWQERNRKNNKFKFLNKFIDKTIILLNKSSSNNINIQEKKKEITNLKSQRFDLIKLIFKEPTKEYRNKIIENIKAINQKIKSLKNEIKSIKKVDTNALPKNENNTNNFLQDIHTEISTLTGYILFVYLSYYFIAILFTNNKFFGIKAPKGFYILENNLFKNMLIIFFIIHINTAINTNFFSKNKLSNILSPIIAIFLIIITILNF